MQRLEVSGAIVVVPRQRVKKKDSAQWRQLLFLRHFFSPIGTRERVEFIVARRALETNQIRSDGVRNDPQLRAEIALYRAPNVMSRQRCISPYLCG